jgi:hypothetical protein
MATRALEYLNAAMVIDRTVITGGAVTLGYAVKFDTDDDHITNMAATTDDCIGIALETAVALAHCRVALWGAGVAKGKVGTAATTRGCPQCYSADGLTDATVTPGANKLVVLGQALQSGTVGQLVGINLAGFCFSCTT